MKLTLNGSRLDFGNGDTWMLKNFVRLDKTGLHYYPTKSDGTGRKMPEHPALWLRAANPIECDMPL